MLPGTASLVLGFFASELFAFQTAVERAEQLGVYTPFVQFLDLPDASFIEARRFTALIPFLRGF